MLILTALQCILIAHAGPFHVFLPLLAGSCLLMLGVTGRDLRRNPLQEPGAGVSLGQGVPTGLSVCPALRQRTSSCQGSSRADSVCARLRLARH